MRHPMAGQPARRQPARGLTLVELLVVIAIVMVLTGLLVPVLAAARARAQTSRCQSQVRQLGLAWRAYAEDYDGRAPDGAYTRFAADASGASTGGRRYTALWGLRPYLRTERLFVCPTRLGWDFSTTSPSLDTHRPRQGSYTSNQQAMAVRLSRIRNVSDLVVFVDSYNPWLDCYRNCGGCTGGCSSYVWDRLGRGTYQGDPELPTAWHQGGVSVVYTDGHAGWRRLDQLRYANFVRNLPEIDPHYQRPITLDW